VIFKDKVKNIIEADLGKYADGDEEVSSTILDDFDKEKYPQLSDDEKVIIVEAILDSSIRPALANDGGGLEVIEVEGPIVRIRYQGACGGCPSSTGGTLRVIENHLRSQLDPDIKVHTYT
jgi:Fe-S cluster biogenesis protein NfuA